MKILVAVKRVIDYNVKIRVKPDQSNVDLANVKMAINPFCEIAVEEAVKLKEAGVATEVVVVSVGSKNCQEQLRASLALGADRAIHLDTELILDSINIAKLLVEVVNQEKPQLVIMGKQAIDTDNNQTGQMLAALANMPQATFASEISVTDECVQVTQEVDGGSQTISLNFPALITTDLRLNTPRYATLPNIMKAKRKPLDVIAVDSFEIDLTPRTAVLKVTPPPEKSSGIIVDSVDELIEKLKNEAKVIA